MDQKQEQGGITLPVTWVSDPNQKTIHANQLLLSNLGGAEYYLQFGEAVPPAVLDIAKERDKLQPVSVNVVARIAVSPKTLALFAQLIQQTLEHREPEGAETTNAR
jgi:hypothetical protein